MAMDDSTSLCAIKHADGSVSLYVDEAYAIDRGVDPTRLAKVPIPRELYASGTIQQIREYVANYLDERENKPT